MEMEASSMTIKWEKIIKIEQSNTFILPLLSSSNKANTVYLEQFQVADLKVLSKHNCSYPQNIPKENSAPTSYWKNTLFRFEAPLPDM